MIIDGRINVKRGVVKRFTPDGLEFEDGTELRADLVVFATGFEFDKFPEDVDAFLGPEVVGRLGPFWGLDEEGEMRGLGVERGGAS